MSTAVLANDNQSPAVEGQFSSFFRDMHLEDLKVLIHKSGAREVEQALSMKRCTIADFAALISPAAEAYLSAMVRRSEMLTRQRFGLGIQLFAPLYLSNTCANECTYCGFSMSNPIKRLTLNPEQIEAEIRALKARGFDQILLVTGETRRVGVDYLEAAIQQIRPHFSQVSMEVQPLDTEDYRRLRRAGLDGVLVYQETYQRDTYLAHHLRGNKRDFNYRLDTADRLGRAEMHRIGLGILLGLDDWRIDSLVMAQHLRFLQKRYWKSRFSVGFPRIRPAAGEFQPAHLISDRQLVQLVAAWRIFEPDLDLSLSTRETPEFRRHAIHFGFTQMSAESKTRPGGYSGDAPDGALEQFETSDERPVSEVVRMIEAEGLEVVWKDWDRAYSQGAY